MADVTEYKCPSCGAPMRFDINDQSMVCRFCSKKYDLEYVRSHFNEIADDKLSDFDWVDRTKYVWEPYEQEKFEEFECSSCGGKIVTKSFYASARCPYCKHYVIIPSDLDGDIRPDKVIPFKVTSAEFWDKYTEYLSEFRRVPKEFHSKSAKNDIIGYYIPIWRYSCKYEPEESYSVIVNDYPILANDADVKEDVFYTLLPYDYSEAEEFSESCLTGFCASRYIIGAENAMKMTDSVLRMDYNVYINAVFLLKKDDEEPLDTSEKLDRLMNESLNQYMRNRKLAYYLVPVWLLKIKYNDEEFTYAMNGQTGEMRVDRIPRKSRLNLFFWSAFAFVCLLISMLSAYGFCYHRNDDLEKAILFIVAGVNVILFNYGIARKIRKKIPTKKVYLNSKRYDEQKIWSLDDFSSKHLSKRKRRR
ncbi:hypothetical protein [Ruminococcus sp.]|uniref:hypothetical protein n=1 Tax=Ruminococcus sp. TaxID=41978 RepID=UPI0025F380B0|nr:hypothetical protein [Ruminococcus sp.]